MFSVRDPEIKLLLVLQIPYFAGFFVIGFWKL